MTEQHESNDVPSPDQLRALAERFRTILDHGLAGATVGDNELARLVLACDIAANANELRAEIERLRGRVTAFAHAYDKLEDEVERLRADLTAERELYRHDAAQWADSDARLRAALEISELARDRALAEIERLRADLDAHCRPCLGLASTQELTLELAARTGPSTDPDYRVIGDLDAYRKARGLGPLEDSK